MKKFREHVRESMETTAIPTRDGKYICNVFTNSKNTPIEVFNTDGDFITLKTGDLYKKIIDIWKDSDEVDWDEYVLSFGSPNWDADNVVINMNKTKLGKIERELDKLKFS